MREFEKGGEEKKIRREKRNVLVPLSNLKSMRKLKLFFWMIEVRTRFEFLAQCMNGLRPKKPKTMNL